MKNYVSPGYDRLRELYHYDPTIGVFINLTDYGRKTAGTPVTTKHLWIDGHRYRLGRLAWFYVHGRMPGPTFHQIDGDERNIKLENLTEGRGGKLLPEAKGHLKVEPTKTGYRVTHVRRMGRPSVKVGEFDTVAEVADAVERLLG